MMPKFAETLASAVALTEASYDNENVGDDGAVELAEIVKRKAEPYPVSLQKLSLRRCGISDVGGQVLGAALGDLLEVQLTGNRLGDKTAIALAASLKSLTRLGLANNRIGTKGVTALAEALKQRTIEELVLSGNPIGDQGLLTLADVSVKSLRLEACGLSDVTAARKLAGALRTNRVLRVLSLGRNDFEDDAVIAIFRAMEDQRSLTDLSVADNRFGPLGACAVGAALLRNACLHSLDLSGNTAIAGSHRSFFDSREEELPKAAIAIADGLCKNSALTHLDLRRCAIGSQGALALRDAVLANVHLDTLLFDEGNRANRDAIAALAKALVSSDRQRSAVRDRYDTLARSSPCVRPPTTKATEQQDNDDDNEEEEEASSEQEPPLPMDPKQVVNVPVSYGRRQNIVGQIACSATTSLAEARKQIDEALTITDAKYNFVGIDGKRTFPRDEEDKRQVLLDCGRRLSLRPSCWITLDEV